MKRRRNGSWERVNSPNSRSLIWGVASTGQKSRQGTVEQVEHADGSVDAIIRPEPVALRTIAASPSEPLVNVNLAALEERLRQAIRNGEVRTVDLGNGQRQVDFPDFVKWVNSL